MDITQLTKPLSRKALQRRTRVYFLWRYVANGGRTARALLTRLSSLRAAGISRELRRRGIVVAPSERFLTHDGQQALDEATARILATSRSHEVRSVVDASGAEADDSRKKDYLVHLVSYPKGIPADDPVLRVALDPKLLQAISGYLGLWPCLHSVGAWLNYPTDAPPELSQLWHRDPEDVQIIKVFIYLKDVGEQSGPFTYIPGTHPFGSQNPTAERLPPSKRIADERMVPVFPPEAWRVCTGPAGTMVLADTVGFHRGGKPTAGERILITFTYTSGSPITSRKLHVREMPAWATSGIQRYAVRELLRSAKPARAKAAAS